MHTEGHDMGKPDGVEAHASQQHDSEHPGYETQDVSIGGVVTFLAGLAGSVAVFFFFCFAMGKAINYALAKHDGTPDKWHTNLSSVGVTAFGQKREDLTSSATIEQRQLQRMTQVFPTPRLETDDGDQDLADLHAREDLLLNYYSTSSDLPSGTVRIPIQRAMELVVQRGLPQASASAQPVTLMAGESMPVVTAPLTSGFARTGYELETIEARNERNEYKQAQEKR
jgi:hypothetical protein